MLQPSTVAESDENIVHRLPLILVPQLQPAVLLHVRPPSATHRSFSAYFTLHPFSLLLSSGAPSSSAMGAPSSFTWVSKDSSLHVYPLLLCNLFFYIFSISMTFIIFSLIHNILEPIRRPSL
jgi:hypothetical protein